MWAFSGCAAASPPNHKTLADFRVAHGAVLETLLVDGFSAMLRTGQASLQRVAQDGMRVRAAAGAASFRRHASLARCREAAAELRRLREELEADPGALSRRQAAQRERAAKEREERVTAAIAVVERIEASRKSERDKAPPDGGETAGTVKKKAPEPRASTTDVEARVMKMADGGFRPAFNVGFATDTVSGMVAAVTIGQQRQRHGQARADERQDRRRLRPAPGRAPRRWRLRRARRHRASSAVGVICCGAPSVELREGHNRGADGLREHAWSVEVDLVEDTVSRRVF
ncbi:MAG: hypothetical protein QGD90_02510 [Candidatus Hydrogenedentes bacterium]|nr:hypothetical protein [Candidatus Hydrogenedentota bacterium]